MRSGKITVILLIFLLLGIMNPAIAKLTPWMLEAMADSLSEAGMTVSEVTVDAMTSWVQFFKNAPMGLIAFILLEAGIFTDEYRTGSMVLVLTKGMNRYKIFRSNPFMERRLLAQLRCYLRIQQLFLGQFRC